MDGLDSTIPTVDLNGINLEYDGIERSSFYLQRPHDSWLRIASNRETAHNTSRTRHACARFAGGGRVLTKRLFGLTPSQFITKSRIAAASRMLRDLNKSVSEIAHACGFYDHSAFTRAFRSATGMTPSEFRTQQ
ncbi:MAG: AraC family transcriptional regulator [Planctomycetota bacterium]|nr:MAG: AraC family transcriptional regulator [Planctomycetota bacterium]